MIRIAAVVSTLSLLGFLLIRFLGGSSALAYLLFGVATVAIVLLLRVAYRILSGLEGGGQGDTAYWMRGHILLHGVPYSFLVLNFLAPTVLLVHLLYLLPVMLFFWTGRVMWRTLHQRYGSKMYKIFFLGNSSMLVMLPVMLGLGALFGGGLADAFRRLLLAYFTIHLMLTGIAVVKIEQDAKAGVSE